RLILRRFEDRDIEPFATYRSDPDVARYQSWEAPYTIVQSALFVETMNRSAFAVPGEWYQIAVELKRTGYLIGDCAFCISKDDGQQAEIGCTFDQGFQRKGLATEAVKRLLEILFDEFGLHRVHAFCDVRNTASFHLLERLGFRREAHFIESYWSKGAWTSEYSYALLASEWKAQSNINPV
ncbi:MAG: GNAT family protein, partial [Chloroflexota bacterium]